METMTLQTPLGEIEYGEDDRISLPNGIPGFEDTDYALWLSRPEYEPIQWLILERSDGIALPLLDPFPLVEGYTPDIPDEAVELLDAESDDVLVYCVATPRQGQPPTINLRSPVVINPEKRLAIQVILSNEEYDIRYDWADAPAEKAVE